MKMLAGGRPTLCALKPLLGDQQPGHPSADLSDAPHLQSNGATGEDVRAGAAGIYFS